MARKNHHLEALKMADAQRKRASLARLQSKKAREKTVEIELPTETGDGTEKVELLFRSIGATEYDRLVTKFPPTSAQRKEGASYNIDLFAPALLAATVVDPQMTDEEARELWNSDAWNRGELLVLFREAIDICITGVSMDPTGSVFE
jgi:hypothetical protein